MVAKSKPEKKIKDGTDIQLPLIIFEEGGATICYCPALDLSGYGYSETEAMESYNYNLSEYFDHTIKTNTLAHDLRRLGWLFNNNKHKNLIPPPVTSLLSSNSNFKRVFEKFNYKKLSSKVHFPSISG